MSARVVLSAQQLAWAVQVGRARHAINTKRGRASGRISRRHTDEEIHILGAMAEVAVSVYEGRPIRCVVTIGDTLRSAVGPDVGEWQVKYTSLWPPRLTVPVALVHKQHDTRYLLVTGEPPEFLLLGWIAGADLFDVENIRHLPWGASYVAPLLHDYGSMEDA